MSTSETISGSGNTGLPGYVTIGAGVKFFYDEATVATTVEGSGQTSLNAQLGSEPVLYFTGGGSGSITASGPGDALFLSGSKWLFNGSSLGAESIYSTAGNATINTRGTGSATADAEGFPTTPSNFVELAGTNAVVNSFGTNDLIESFAGHDTIHADGSANVLVDGGHVTVNVNGYGPVRAAFSGTAGGTLDFINNSSVSATVSGNVPGGYGGSVTAFGGAAGGYYAGASGGNNSLVGGAGAVTLVGAGNNNHLKAAGYAASYEGQNVLIAGIGSNGDVMIAESTSGYNEFHGGSSGADTMESFGQGAQTFFVGAGGTESIVGSTVSGAANEYIFDQDSTGNGQDIITNFRVGTDDIDINLNDSLSGVTIASFNAIGGAHPGTFIELSNNTTITLYGVSPSTLNHSIIGGTHI
jgi:hypothetical protein